MVPRAVGEVSQPFCLYRATDGKKRKVATQVSATDAPQFHALLMGVLKVGMVGLRKVEKKKAAKPKAAKPKAAGAAK